MKRPHGYYERLGKLEQFCGRTFAKNILAAEDFEKAKKAKAQRRLAMSRKNKPIPRKTWDGQYDGCDHDWQYGDGVPYCSKCGQNMRESQEENEEQDG